MPANNHNPFSSDFLRSGADDRLRPQGTLSYVAGATDDPLKYMTIPQLLDRACARFGGRPAAIFAEADTRLSWYDLRARSDDVAAGLLALGIGRGDRVGIWAPNRAEWLYVQFGTARIGAILVNINPAYRASELEHALNKVGCKALVLARRHKSSDYVDMLRTLAPETRYGEGTLRAARLPHLRHVIVLGEGPRAARRAVFRALDVACRARPPRPSRGLVRGTRSGRRNQHPVHQRHNRPAQGSDTLPFQYRQQRALSRRNAMALSAEDRLCIPVPLYHCFGMVLGVLCCTAVGADHGIPRRKFRCRGDAVGRSALPVHGVARRADDVYCPARASEFRELRPFHACAPASWPARHARSRPCARWRSACTCARSPSATA